MKAMNSRNKKRLHSLLISASVMLPLAAWAAEKPAEPVMRCGSGMSMPDSKDKSATNAEPNMSMEMQMQGGSAPANARDPHAWSDGYTHNPNYPLEMADQAYFGMLMFDRLEQLDATENTTAFETHAWFGKDYNKLVFMAEGELIDGELEESRSGIFWGHAVSTFWDTQLGLRHDANTEKDRNWLAYGVQGLAPYWFEVRAMVYLGDNGRSAVDLMADYELLFTQKLILQPAIEINAYGKADPQNRLGSGLADVSAGLRLRYEFTRQFAPYIGIEWMKLLGGTADIAQASGETGSNTHWLAGVRFWF